MGKTLKVLTGTILASSMLVSSFGAYGKASAETAIPVNVLAVKDESGDWLAINGTNSLSNANKLIMFNDTWSYYTETALTSSEVVLEKTGLNTYKVAAKRTGDSAIPENGLVLSTGSATTPEISGFISQLQEGETITLKEPTEKSAEMAANSINGIRGADQLIVYTPEFGASTKTNEYGYEITVENGVVVKLGGGNSQIPQNGFVLSGHGKAKDWLSGNSIIGAKVTVDENRLVKIVQDVESFQFQSQQSIAKAKEQMAKAKTEFLDVAEEEAAMALQSAESLLKQAQEANSTNPVLALDLTRQATQAAYDAYYYSLPSNAAEQRAIWYRPEETTLAGVEQVLDRMQKAGFNSVYLETTFWGYTIYPSKTMEEYGLPAVHPRFQDADYGGYGNDLLKAYIEEGKKRGLTIQAWTDGFMIGHGSLGLPSQFQKYPHWAAIQRSNTTGQPKPDHGNQYYWLDIVQPEVQQFMLDIYEEMQSTYDIKGLDIDYMRYPHHKYEQSYGYSEKAREMYKEQTGIDPLSIADKTPEWAAWLKWIRDRENDFVDKLHEQSKAMDKKFMLTATPEPGPEAGQIADWKDDLDGVIPQAYGHDFNSIQSTINASKKLMPGGMMYYGGIYSFYHHLSEMAAVSDVLAARHGTSGVNMFAFGQASAPSVDALGKGPWREKAVNPGEEPVKAALAVLKKIEQQITQIYIQDGALDKREGISLKHDVQELGRNVREDAAAASFDALSGKIGSLASSGKLAQNVAERMKAQLVETKLWINYHLEHQN